MEKLIYMMGETEPGTPARNRTDLRDRLLELAPQLISAGARAARLTVSDLDGAAHGALQVNADGIIDAQLSFWLDTIDDRKAIEDMLTPLATRVAGYLVTESIPLDRTERDWPNGERTPGVALVSTFHKPDWIDDETFYARWHGSHTPLSLKLHPLLQYVRNAVARPLTKGAPPLRAIVMELVESIEIAVDPVRFYGSLENKELAFADMKTFLSFSRLSNSIMSEYILSSD